MYNSLKEKNDESKYQKYRFVCYGTLGIGFLQ